MDASRKVAICLAFLLITAVVVSAEKVHDIWTGFQAGELSPYMDGQVNLDEYRLGAKTMENFIPRIQGPVSNRSGFKYIAETKTSSKMSRLVPFEFSTTQAYVIEFGDLYARFYANQGQLVTVDSETKLLMSMNGTQASTTFYDDSPTPKTMTAGGDARLTTTYKKFSTASGYWDGTSDFVTAVDHADFDLSATDGGIDVWVMPRVGKGDTSGYTLFHQDVIADAEVYMKAYLDDYTKVLLNFNSAITDRSLNTKTVAKAGSGTLVYNVTDQKYGKSAINFTGDYELVVSAHADFDYSANDTYTVEMWISPDDLTTQQVMFSHYQDSDNYLNMYIKSSTGDLAFDHKMNTDLDSLTCSGVFTLNEWSHVVAVNDGTTIALFVDGTRCDTETVTTDIIDLSASNIVIGSNISNRYYDGLMDDLSYSSNEKYDAGTSSLTQPTVQNNLVAHACFEIGDTVPTVDTVCMPTDDVKSWRLGTGGNTAFTHIEINYDVSEPQVYMFTNGQLHSGGVQAMTLTASGALDSAFTIGSNVDQSTEEYQGWMDEFRFSAGTLRHTASFTPEVVEYIVSGSSVYEIVTTYKEEDLAELQYAQSGDTMFIVHPDYVPRTLTRSNNTTWVMADYGIINDLYLTTAEITSNGLDGTETEANLVDDDITNAGYAHHAATDVAGDGWEFSFAADVELLKIRINVTDGDLQSAWKVQYDSDDNGNWVDGATDVTGATIDMGEQGDGWASIEWEESDYDGAAHPDWRLILTATAGEGGTISEIETYGLAYPSSWASGSYPSSVVFYENRLWFAYFQTLWASVAGDYNNFALGPNSSDGMEYTIASDQVNTIQWLSSGKILVAGTAGGEYKISATNQEEAITPTNIRIVKQSSYGSQGIQPVAIRDVVLYVQRGGRKVREFSYEFQKDLYVSPDLTAIADHVTSSGIKAMDYAAEPFSTLWAVRNDGVLAAMSYNRDSGTVGWSRHTTDGTFESIASIPTIQDDGDYDEVWVIVNRTINGATARYIELLQPQFSVSDTLSTIRDNGTPKVFYVDSGLGYNGVATTTFSGLDHLEGETVTMYGEGPTVQTATVSSGSITAVARCTNELVSCASNDDCSGTNTCQQNYTYAVVGLPYTSTLQTMRWAGAQGVQGRKKSINEVVFRLINAKQFKYGVSDDSDDLRENIFTALYTGDYEADLRRDTNREGHVVVVNDKPLPLTVVAIMPEVNVP